MRLLELKDYFITHKRACMADLVNRFHADAGALRPMLAMLQARGRIRRVEMAMNCGSCAKCDPARLEIYEWCG